MATVLIVDDNPDICEVVVEYLTQQGYEAHSADGPAAMRERWNECEADLVLLDVNLPGEDGFSLARWLRSKSNRVALIMLTGADTVLDRVVGLELGADDYVTKPFDLRELLARVRSVLRRTLQADEQRHGRRVRFGQCVLDLDARKLLGSDGEPLPLTAMEFDLLLAFAEHPNKVLTRDRLLDLAHNRDSEPFDRSIDIRITRIRRKIESDPKQPEVIKTVRGAGYIFVHR